MTTSNKNKKRRHDVKEMAISFATTLTAIGLVAFVWLILAWFNNLEYRVDDAQRKAYELREELKEMKASLAKKDSAYAHDGSAPKIYVIETSKEARVISAE